MEKIFSLKKIMRVGTLLLFLFLLRYSLQSQIEAELVEMPDTGTVLVKVNQDDSEQIKTGQADEIKIREELQKEELQKVEQVKEEQIKVAQTSEAQTVMSQQEAQPKEEQPSEDQAREDQAYEVRSDEIKTEITQSEKVQTDEGEEMHWVE